MVHTSQQNRENSPCYTEKSASRRDMDRKSRDITFRHWPLSTVGFHLKILQLLLKNAMGHSSSHVNVLSASHRHFAPLASTHTVTQMTGGHAEMHPKRDPKHVCRWASPWVHVQRSKNALGLVNFWILLQLHFIHPDQTVTSWHLCYSPHDLRSQLRHHFHII